VKPEQVDQLIRILCDISGNLENIYTTLDGALTNDDGDGLASIVEKRVTARRTERRAINDLRNRA